MAMISESSRNSTDHPIDEVDEEAASVSLSEQPQLKRRSSKKRHEKLCSNNLEETSHCGHRSNLEIVSAIVIFLMVVAGTVLGLFYAFRGDGIDTIGESRDTPSDIMADEALFADGAEQFRVLVEEIQKEPAVASTILANFDVTSNGQNMLPLDAYTRAALWLVNDDPKKVKLKADLLPRFVLAVTYFSNGGDQWKSSENWLTEVDVCQWDGIQCTTTGELQGVFLSNYNLKGEIHSAWAFLKTCRSIHLNSNKLEGPIPGESFGNMNKLLYLYLNSNELTGTIPLELRKNGILKTIFVQENLLEGEWPVEFCPDSLDVPLNEFSIDCDRVECSCCVPILNCFSS